MTISAVNLHFRSQYQGVDIAQRTMYAAKVHKVSPQQLKYYRTIYRVIDGSADVLIELYQDAVEGLSVKPAHPSSKIKKLDQEFEEADLKKALLTLMESILENNGRRMQRLELENKLKESGVKNPNKLVAALLESHHLRLPEASKNAKKLESQFLAINAGIIRVMNELSDAMEGEIIMLAGESVVDDWTIAEREAYAGVEDQPW